MALNLVETKSQLADRIKSFLGEPVIKVELTQQQIYNCIDLARDKFVKWASGQATTETYFTLMLRFGQNFYDLPTGVVDIIDYKDNGRGYGINTLFTIENFLYNQGIYNGALWAGRGYGIGIIDYHTALDFLETIERYTPSVYNYKYHRFTNQLEVQPAPTSGSILNFVNEQGKTQSFDSPGFLLLRSQMIEGSHYNGMSTTNTSTYKRTGIAASTSDSGFYTSDWVFEYSLANAKIILGNIRRKFAQFSSIGNTGISLDGDQLIQEGLQEKERLEATLRNEEVFDGYEIVIG
jgi:hypothetical protein